MRERILSSVDFPDPFLPTTPTTSPCSTSKLTSRKAQSSSVVSRRDRIRCTGCRTSIATSSRSEPYAGWPWRKAYAFASSLTSIRALI